MRLKALRLYKDLLRYGQSLQFTDKSYFRVRVRKSFYENKDLEDLKEIEFCIKRGEQALKRRSVV